MLLEGDLYHVERDKTLRVIPPECDRRHLFDEVHGSAFSGHLRGCKDSRRTVGKILVAKDVIDIGIQWCQACLVRVSQQVGQVVCLPLTPILVAGPFDHAGVDVLHFKSAPGNKYAVVFVNYLIKWPEVLATLDQSALTIAKLLG